jgi:HrpA-like RNA helicase
MDAIIENDIVAISGATGSGKSTQVPQYILEAGFGDIRSGNPGKVLMTQPRRVAAVSIAERIRHELGDVKYVSYRTRHESSVFSDSAMEVVTDGILIREIVESPLLEKYSVVILDEVHERSYNNDILISMLCRILKARNSSSSKLNPIRIILMSACIDNDVLNFVQVYGSFSSVEIEGQAYPVRIHYSRRNPEDIVRATSRKIKKIIERLPSGKVLAFLPSKNDLWSCSEDLRGINGVNVFCVHGTMSKEKQNEIFECARDGIDVFIATNVAETSITIPDVTYVIDSGKVKRKIYDGSRGTYNFIVDWICKASSLQRCGRTGRTVAGHCYRLYTAETFYDTFEESETPEITRIRLDSHVLFCKRMGISDPAKLNMPIQPSSSQIEASISRLSQLNIMDESAQIRDEYLLLGDLPLLPECAVIIINAILCELRIEELSLAVLFGITMSFDEIFLDMKECIPYYKPYFRSDVLLDSCLVSLHHNGVRAFSANENTLNEIIKLYKQVGAIIKTICDESLHPIGRISFSKSVCDSVRELCACSPKYLTAVRAEIASSGTKYSYICSDDQSEVYISKRSVLFRQSPRIICFRGRVKSSRNDICILNRITDITK